MALTRTQDHAVTLAVDFTACDGHGLCAELLPELVGLDEWGYPVLHSPTVPPELLAHARRAVAACPVMALRVTRGPSAPPAPPPDPLPGRTTAGRRALSRRRPR
jgi:ferredoxin